MGAQTKLFLAPSYNNHDDADQLLEFDQLALGTSYVRSLRDGLVANIRNLVIDPWTFTTSVRALP